MKGITDIPFFVILMALSCIAMFFPILHAIRLEDWLTARTFFYNGAFLGIITTIIGIAVRRQDRSASASTHLITMLCAYVVLPIFLAMPFAALVKTASFFQSYFEMLSSLTTTGATLFDDPKVLSEPLHLWRSLVGWLGGFMILVVAMAIFAPLNMGGFEIYALQRHRKEAVSQMQKAEVSERLNKFANQIFPIYLMLTLVLTFTLIILGERAFIAVTHAMAILSTSGISPVGGLSGSSGGFFVELVMFLFLFFAVSRNTFLPGREQESWRTIKHDKEITQALLCITIIPALLFIRHWTGAIEANAQGDAITGVSSLWGSSFTILSFLTTTGFESQSWGTAQNWSGLGTPGLIFIGLSALGGGVATTAGGIKLLRIYALYKHGIREMERLSYPSSVGGAGQRGRAIRREGAFIAWIFLMVFVFTLGIIMLGLTLTGLDFEEALVFAVAALATCGPLVGISIEGSSSYILLSDEAKAILCVAMILGRLETVAVIALFNPNYWR
ncbi:TrkH family potassium uptake protein [Amylibacter sp. SFDW26]|uniref:TrkH family potassium uptake protein n=1 Tax=Amylibacter sp. SFDW26 TaxID=2652722 RepID=UPI0012627C0F|nr:potassium transporter TrkG [Amylibacter sp. SFDW26]KAB7615750.1 TrkH family potassium uptake protein [Amylibacter sp. SFDW26]